MTTSKFKLSPARQGTGPAASSISEFAGAAAMVTSQADTKPARMFRLNLDIDAEAHRRLKIRAIEEEVTVSDIIRKLVAGYLDSRR
jgi:hypothetical protein